MQQPPLSKTKLESKLAIIREAVIELHRIAADTTKEEFIADKVKFGFTEHNLRRALEAVFDIGGHVISRFVYAPGARPKEYKEIALALGDKGIVAEEFAREKLAKMAGYRNRLVHMYYEVTREELFEIIKNNIGDLELFGREIVQLIENPSRVGLIIEE